MSELTMGQLIKIIIGIIVFVVVVFAIYLFFKDQVLGFFKGLFSTETNLILNLIK